MGKIVNWQFGDNLEFKHPICSDCKGNTFHVQISENDDVILHCVKCMNVIDFDLKFSAEYKALEAETSKLRQAIGLATTCAPDLHIERLEYELEECRCIKSSYFDDSLKCRQEFKRLEAKLAALVEAAGKLVDECEAEFTLDGYWNNDGALVTRKTVRKLKSAIFAAKVKEG